MVGGAVIDHWWQTETGWPIAANCMGLDPLPVKPGSPTKAVPGYQVDILDEAGNTLPPNRQGAVAIRFPLPPGTSPTLEQNAEPLRPTYLPPYPRPYLSRNDSLI